MHRPRLKQVGEKITCQVYAVWLIKLGEWVTVLVCPQKVLSSNLSRNTACRDHALAVFSTSIQVHIKKKT
jgi:hypothetical protein